MAGDTNTADTASTQQQPITAWSEWGPGWGQAGLSVARYNNEGLMNPQAGDIDNNPGMGRGMIEWRNVTAAPDGTLNFLDSNLFPRIAESLPKSAYKWAGMVEHVHTYLKASDSIMHSAVLKIESSPYPADIWLNGQSVSSGQVTLQPGWNSLMVKSRSPRTATGDTWTDGWWFKAALLNATANIQVQTNDPARKTLVTGDQQPFRFLSTWRRNADGDAPIIALNSAELRFVVLDYELRVGIGTASNYQHPSKRSSNFKGWPWVYSIDPASIFTSSPHWTVVPTSSWVHYAPSRARMVIRNDQGKVILSKELNLAYSPVSADGLITATQRITVNPQPAGHYTIASDLLDPHGAVLAHDNDHSFSVVWGAVDKTKDEKPRLVSVTGHWFMGVPDRERQQRWLNRLGITRHLKLWEGWDRYEVKHNGNGAITVGPALEIATAIDGFDSQGISVVGDLVEGYYDSSMDNLRVPGLSAPLPPYGTNAWNTTLYNYGYRMASKYRGKIDAWSGNNEVDNFAPDTPRAAELHVQAAYMIAAGMKAANPGARYFSSSLVSRAKSKKFFSAGFLSIPDVVDVHSHPWKAPEPNEDSLTPYSQNEGRTMLIKEGYTGPIVYGETSSPRAHNARGAQGHAEDLVKQIAWAINHREIPIARLEGISYLVAYGGPDYWSYNMGFNNQYGDPLPIVNAVNVANHLLDGRKQMPALTNVPAGVSHIRVTNADLAYPQTVVVWSTKTAKNVTFQVKGSAVKLINAMGRVNKHRVSNGAMTLQFDTTPQFLQGSFTD
ncbi:MAG: hypothetical protein WA970_20600 [Gammaproteobacteria bacterium]